MSERVDTPPELAAMARRVIDSNLYMTVGTADQNGQPWATPVFFTPDGYDELYWVSSPDTRHSQNIALRPDVGVVVFDSRVAIGTAEAVYMSAHAEQVPDHDLERAADVYQSRLPAGSRAFGPEQLRAPALFRLYRARVTEHSVLIRGGDPVYGRGADSRMTVHL